MKLSGVLPTLRLLFRNLYFLAFLNGVAATSLLYFVIESRYESELFTAISRKIKSELPPGFSKEHFILRAVTVSNYLQERRFMIFGNQYIGGIKANLLHPSTVDLMTNNGACGSYVTVLSRILKANNIRIRIGQMQVNGKYGGHIFVEAKLQNRWVVLDPTFNLYFRNTDNSLATFKELQANWDSYKDQLPAGYNHNYRFEGVRYTNWEKIPVVLPLLKNLLLVTAGKEMVDSLSIRTFLLRNYYILSWFTGLFWLLLLAQTFNAYFKQRLP